MFFQHVQALTCYLCLDSFEALLAFMLKALEPDAPDSGLLMSSSALLFKLTFRDE